jgi:hypothetical protein
MRRLCINLPANRDFEGEVWIEDETGQLAAGPFPVSGRAADSIAAQHHNPDRDPRFPYGDPPTGAYKIVGLRETGAANGLRPDLYGRAGAIVLQPWSGDAALAEAVGRFEVLIHGGAPGDKGALRMGAGGFRVSDEALAALRAEVQGPAAVIWAVCGEDGELPEAGASSRGLQEPVDWPVASAPRPRPSWTALGVMAGEYSPTDDPDIGQGRIQVDPAADTPSIVQQAGDELVGAARDLGLTTLDAFGGKPIPEPVIAWTEPAAKLAGGLTGAGELFNDGQTEAAYAAAKSAIVDVMPDVAAGVAVDAAVPTLVEATVAIGIGSAVAGMTLSAGAILVTSAVVVVGMSAAVAMGTKKLTEVCIDLAKKHL